jgi:hypothetical protein
MKRQIQKYAFSLGALALAGGMSESAQAHPVFFADGYGLTINSAHESVDVYSAYTLSHRMALGARYIGYRTVGQTPQDNLVMAQSSFLLKRWNAPASQANIYLTLSGGNRIFTEGPEDRTLKVGMMELQADWEDRRYYTMAESRVIGTDTQKSIYESKARLGFAPYLAEYKELNTWIILEASERWNDNKAPSVTPFLRLFYNNFLTEIGYSLDGKMKFNLMTHL